MTFKALLIDGYIDDPAALGVPPYISPMARAIGGAAMDGGCDVEYLTIDMIRNGTKIPDADISVVLSGNTVPGKYIRSMPMSLKELSSIADRLKGWKWIGGSAADSEIANKFDFVIKKDIAASLYDGIIGKEIKERYRTLEEWNRWMLLGSEIVMKHQDYPSPLVVEIETYRGCHRYSNGGCSYCIEPLKGKPLMRKPSDIIAEAKKLKSLGIKNIRLGGQTCIISYGSDENPIPCPNPDVFKELFYELKKLDFNVFHVDNANPSVIANYPQESEEIIKTIAECCTSGNVLALGMESADPMVIKENNLNSYPEEVLFSIELINKHGRKIGENGMPLLLPGLNIICGLDGETKNTYDINQKFLQSLLEKDLLVRRINIRQVLPVRREFNTKVDKNRFKKFKESVREEIDHEMLKKTVPKGTVLRNVYTEIHDGNITFGRQIGSYPLLIGIPYKLELERFYNIMVTDWGMRSITGVEYPFRINTEPMSNIASLPGIGKKRASTIVMNRPFDDFNSLSKHIDDKDVLTFLEKICVFDL